MNAIPDKVRQLIGEPRPFDPTGPVLTQSELVVGGRKVSNSVACRWMTVGRNGVLLPSLRVNRNRISTPYWFAWWCEAQRRLESLQLAQRQASRAGSSTTVADVDAVEQELDAALGVGAAA